MPVPTITAVGVASPSAHGHATTSTLTAARSTSPTVTLSGANDGTTPVLPSIPTTVQIKPTAAAIIITVGTNIPATLSAVLEMGAFVACASSTRSEERR